MNAPGQPAALSAADTAALDALTPAIRSTALPAPTMGKLQKIRYSHQAMIDLIIQNPWISQNDLAAHFGYTPAWVSNVLASDAFQSAMAVRREEVVDPAMKATIEERFKALVHLSLTRLMEKLEQPSVPANVALKAAELGAKSLGVGGHAPPAPSGDRLQVLAERLIVLNPNPRKEGSNGEIEINPVS